MATTDTYDNRTGVTGLINSFVGFTYASTMYSLRLMFTNPFELTDRMRISLDNVSHALTDSMERKLQGDGSQRRSASEVVRDTVDSTAKYARETADKIGREAAELTQDPDILSGRKR